MGRNGILLQSQLARKQLETGTCAKSRNAQYSAKTLFVRTSIWGSTIDLCAGGITLCKKVNSEKQKPTTNTIKS
eukprot:4062632-Amphidinium_carterae.1